jgi:hypothetical protein
MSQSAFLQSLLDGTLPRNTRMLMARGLAPMPPHEMLEILVRLSQDNDSEIASQAAQTIGSWEQDEILAQLKSRDCAPAVLDYFAGASGPKDRLHAIIRNPSASEKTIAALALTVPEHLLQTILDNRVRILKFPNILENVRKNPSATPEIKRLAQEIEVEFLGNKKTDYVIEELVSETPAVTQSPEPGHEAPPEDLSLEGLPVDEEARQAAITQRLSGMPVRDKIRYALFGDREIRAVLVRDSNKEVARMVLQSPKITAREIEGISAMRGVAEDILRQIGNSRQWTKSYSVVQNLVKNPKTPPLISQRLLSRLRTQDLTMVTRDRSVSDAVRHGAARVLKQRTHTRAGQ